MEKDDQNREITVKEERIRKLTRLYYSNPKVQEILIDFAKDREVVPRYFEGFGKRPDSIQYVSDIMGLVNKGATSFHGSEELWQDPLQINSDMSQEELSNLRKGWDLLIDIDSPFLDCSKIAAKLIIAALEHHNIKNYGIKFSGSKGFHIIVSNKAFPIEFENKITKEMFPEWPRAISEYLMNYIRKDYNKLASEILTDFEAIERRTKISKEELLEVYCTLSNKPAKKGEIVSLKCDSCGLEAERKDYKITKRVLRCLDSKCPGNLEITGTREYYYCEYCKDPDKPNLQLSSDKHPEFFEKVQGVSAEKIAALDLVLVAPRHLFRMPYSLHEKTSLASVVLTKEELENFSPKDANPLSVKVKKYLPDNEKDEAIRLLNSALDWKKTQVAHEDKADLQNKYKNYKNKTFEKIDIKNVNEGMFPAPINKLLLGLEDGRKRGLFVLLTFLRSLNFDSEYIIKKLFDWNKLNKPPLKDGYVKSQIDWHLKQRKQIMPPNYDNDSFYKDLGLIDKKPNAKNPISEVIRKIRNNN